MHKAGNYQLSTSAHRHDTVQYFVIVCNYDETVVGNLLYMWIHFNEIGTNTRKYSNGIWKSTLRIVCVYESPQGLTCWTSQRVSTPKQDVGEHKMTKLSLSEDIDSRKSWNGCSYENNQVGSMCSPRSCEVGCNCLQYFYWKTRIILYYFWWWRESSWLLATKK